MKIEKAKVFTVGGQSFGSLREAQMHLLINWLGNDARAERIAELIADNPEGFRDVVAPFISKPRGRPRKKVEGQSELKLELGEDGEPQVAAEDVTEAPAEVEKSSRRKAA